MIIVSRKNGLKIGGVKIKAGRFNYPTIDHKDPMTAEQLRTLRDDMKVIGFTEILPDALPVADKEFKKALGKARDLTKKRVAAKAEADKKNAAIVPRKGKARVPRTGKKAKGSGK